MKRARWGMRGEQVVRAISMLGVWAAVACGGGDEAGNGLATGPGAGGNGVGSGGGVGSSGGGSATTTGGAGDASSATTSGGGTTATGSSSGGAAGASSGSGTMGGSSGATGAGGSSTMGAGGSSGAAGTGGTSAGGSGGTGGAGGTGGNACEGPLTGNPVCDQCLGMQCCPQIQACAANMQCKALTDCLRAMCSMAPNLPACAVQNCSAYLGGFQLASAIQTCQQQNCAMACQ